jgi:Flp pilus assembly protein TadB
MGRQSLVVTAGAVIVGLLGLRLASPLLATAGPLLVVAASLHHRQRRQARRRAAVATARLRAVDALVQEVEAGSSLTEACRRFPAGLGLDPMLDSLRNGQPMAAATRSLSNLEQQRPDDQDLGLLVAGLRTLSTDGGPALPALIRLRRALQASIDRRARSQAQAAQALNSAALLALAPVGFALLVALVDPQVAAVYRSEILGAVCGTGALSLAVLGWWWMGRLIGQTVSQRGPANRRRRRRGDPTAAVGSTLDLLAIVIGAGGTVHQAVGAAAEYGPAPTRELLGPVVEATEQGWLLRDALAAVAARAADQPARSGYVPMLQALWSAQAHGAPLRDVLARLADDVDQHNRSTIEARTGRLSVALVPPLVVCFLPAMVIGSVVPLAVTALRSVRA